MLQEKFPKEVFRSISIKAINQYKVFFQIIFVLNNQNIANYIKEFIDFLQIMNPSLENFTNPLLLTFSENKNKRFPYYFYLKKIIYLIFLTINSQEKINELLINELIFSGNMFLSHIYKYSDKNNEKLQIFVEIIKKFDKKIIISLSLEKKNFIFFKEMQGFNQFLFDFIKNEKNYHLKIQLFLNCFLNKIFLKKVFEEDPHRIEIIFDSFFNIEYNDLKFLLENDKKIENESYLINRINNLSYLGNKINEIFKNILPENLSKFFYIFTISMNSLQKYIENIFIENEMDIENIDLNLEMNENEKKKNYQRSLYKEISSKMDLNFFFSRNFFELIENNFKNEKSIIDMNRKFLNEICSFFLKLMKLIRSKKPELIQNVSKSSLMSVFFSILEELVIIILIFKNWDRILLAKYSGILELFCRGILHVIKISDDEDILIEKNNYKKISKFVNEFIFYEYELYNIDSRIHFTEKNSDFWIIPSILEFENEEELLENIPHVFPFSFRLKKLEELMNEDKMKFHFNDPIVVDIRRKFEFEVLEIIKIIKDARNQLEKQNLKNNIYVNFINEFNGKEIGVDGGGLFKEFITLVCRSAFNPDFGFFIETEDKTLIPNPSAIEIENYLK